MLIRKFDRDNLDTEPEKVLYKDIYPWDEIEDTPFGASMAIIEPGGQTMIHSHEPTETFIVFQGSGIIGIDGEERPISQGDVVVMLPGMKHTLKNDSSTDPLMFLSLFWWGDDTDTHSFHMFGDDEGEEVEKGPPRLIFPSPPTSNGPLHVGHLAGPYMMADVIRRFDALEKRNATFVCLTDDHQSYTLSRAELEEKPVEEVAAHYSDQIKHCLGLCLAEPDHFVSAFRDEDYKNAVQVAFKKLYDGGFIQKAEQDVFYCATCQRELFDGHVVGDCPHCQQTSLGFACEQCCLPNKTIDLQEPLCTGCDTPPETRQGERLYFDLEPCRKALEQYHEHLKLTPKLRSLSTRFLAVETIHVPAGVSSAWGVPIPVDGFEGQVISPWLEIGLANHYLRSKVGEYSSVTHTFGYDNAFCYLMADPAVSLALDQTVPLAQELVVNEYLSLNDVKMSTSKGHYLSPEILLGRMPADLLRFYLATVRPEVSETTCSLRHMADMLNGLLIGRWQDWLADLGNALTNEFVSAAPDFEGEWAEEHTQFFAELTTFSNRARAGYQSRRLQMVAKAAIDLVDRTIAFAHEQSHLANLPGYEEQRATGVALELAGARLLALICAPLMPNFGAQLWKILGHHHSMQDEGWPREPRFLPPGQRLLARAGLCARRLFPQKINLDDLIETP
ncbi:MAG: class I tRNA ligase family protein [Vulcanimicrobiota bacterium]